MSYETAKLMVAYFTEGSELISRDDDYAKLPQHLLITPWFYGEVVLAATALEDVAEAYPKPLNVATGSIKTMPGSRSARYLHPEAVVQELHRRVVSALGRYYLRLENPNFKFEPVIVIDQDQPPLPGSLDFEIDHLAIVENHSNGTKSIADCVYIG